MAQQAYIPLLFNLEAVICSELEEGIRALGHHHFSFHVQSWGCKSVITISILVVPVVA